MNSRTSRAQRQATAILAGHFSASSREDASTTERPPTAWGYGPSVAVPSMAAMLAFWFSSPPRRPTPRSSTKPGLPRSGRTPEQPPTEPSEARSRRDGCGQHPGDEVRLHACATCVAARRGHRGVLAVLRGHLTDSPLPDRLHIHIVLPASQCRERTTPRAGEPTSAAAHAGTTRPSRTPHASPRSPPPRSPRSGRRARTPGSARPGRSARRP